MSSYPFVADVWEHDGPGGWHFVSLPPDTADDIEHAHGERAAGFGSVKVDVTVGATTWSTSIFPDRKRGTYVLPVKKAVRAAEHLTAGSQVTVDLRISER